VDRVYERQRGSSLRQCRAQSVADLAGACNSRGLLLSVFGTEPRPEPAVVPEEPDNSDGKRAGREAQRDLG
jgi:hypothetical protein